MRFHKYDPAIYIDYTISNKRLRESSSSRKLMHRLYRIKGVVMSWTYKLKEWVERAKKCSVHMHKTWRFIQGGQEPGGVLSNQ